MPHENPNGKGEEEWGLARCPWGRDCPWDWPRFVPLRTRVRWALQAIWYALSGQHPKDPLLVRAALTRGDVEKLKEVDPAVLDDRGREILETITYYEQELRTFQASGHH